MKRVLLSALLFALCLTGAKAADKETATIKKIYSNALTTDVAYRQLEVLCREAPNRLMGTEASFKALELMKNYLLEQGFDTVFYQPYTSPAWQCHSASASMLLGGKEVPLKMVALGPSASTPKEGVVGEIIEVNGVDEVRALGKEKIAGKIVFYNRPVDPTLYDTFDGYGGAADQRWRGPDVARQHGAMASITRSVTSNIDDRPHSGSGRMEGKKIPAIAISTNDANRLSNALKADPKLKVKIKVDAEDFITNTYNLIADIKGSEKPDEYIVVGGHIDSWHNTDGAHDDGVGCMHATEVLRLFKAVGVKPKRSIRAIMFMDEELFQSGGIAYADYSEKNNISNYFAMESDAGGFTPRRFTIDASPKVVKKIQRHMHYLEPYGIEHIDPGFGGVDIAPLKDKQGVPLCGYRPDGQRYFDMHHCSFDTFDKINFREMQLGSAGMASLIYLIDRFDLAE